MELEIVRRCRVTDSRFVSVNLPCTSIRRAGLFVSSVMCDVSTAKEKKNHEEQNRYRSVAYQSKADTRT